VRTSRISVEFGFNLLELIVTTAVMAITLAIAIPSFNGVIGTSKLRSQANEIQSALTYARTEAIRLNQSVVFCHSNNGINCTEPADTGWEGWLVSPAGGAIAAPVLPVLRFGILDAAPMRITSGEDLAGASHVVRFTPQGLARGFANNTPLSDFIRVCLAQESVNPNTRDIQFNSGGRSRIVATDNAGTCL
jgi:type IV fimbrial biogenesis protein FimT